MMVEKPLIHYQAAGGVVIDSSGQVLLIERIVDGVREIRLPKGHIEPGESPEAAACREVCEETGYCDLEIRLDLGWRTVEFDRVEATVVRDERYYLMALTSDRRQAPQFASEREALFHSLWVEDFEAAALHLTFGAEKDVVQRAQAAIQTRSHSSWR